ncbi:lanthionine synthetase LanC family protein [Chryseobacterium sp. Chry.R1]|uniref:lanthionine synthetase LanC family protein n=1 Tax=Chryseobacterium sp. Chry.R1 TaxID=3139392 RepID=UPI0031FA1956
MTTNKELKEFQVGLDEISQLLLSRVKQDKDGFYWDTIHRDNDSGAISFIFNSSLWNGTGGIAWFFLVLYENYGNGHHLEIAEGSFSKIYHYSVDRKISNSSLYDGITGVIYLGLELFRITGKDLYLQQSAEVYTIYREKILTEQTEDMLIGISGILMVICTLYHFTGDQKLEEDVAKLITTLLEKSLVAESGIKWGDNTLSVDSLCGFSHGNSGIAFCLLQLGRYFDNSEFIWLAEQAFCYEDTYYDPLKNNWLDLRWEDSKNRLPDLFDWNKNTFLSEDFDINAWAHGASGIGTARISALTITDNPAYKVDCKKIFERCRNDIMTRSKRNHILFSGYGGLSDFLLQYHEVFDNKEALELATEITLEALKKSREHGHSSWGIQNSEDLGLMTGTAGIGLSLLMMINGKTFNSILHPELLTTGEKRENIILKNFKIKKIFFERYYPKTLAILKTLSKLEDSIYDLQTIEEFGNGLLNIIKSIPEKQSAYLSDIHQLETIQINIRKKHKGTLCFQTRLIMLKKELEEVQDYDENDLQEKRFIRNPFIDIYESRWNWKEENDMDSEPGKHYNVFYSTDQELFHLILNPFSATVLQILENPLGLEELTASFHYSEKEKEIIEKKVLEQIHQLLTNFFIRISE